MASRERRGGNRFGSGKNSTVEGDQWRSTKATRRRQHALRCKG